MKDSTRIPNFASIRYMDLWLADLPAVPGHVKHGVRPVLVVSQRRFQRLQPHPHRVPLTSQRRTLTRPPTYACGAMVLSVISVAQCEQVRRWTGAALSANWGVFPTGVTASPSSMAWPGTWTIALCVNLAA